MGRPTLLPPLHVACQRLARFTRCHVCLLSAPLHLPLLLQEAASLAAGAVRLQGAGAEAVTAAALLPFIRRVADFDTCKRSNRLPP